jgi:uncharacterized protein (DUF305 family)
MLKSRLLLYLSMLFSFFTFQSVVFADAPIEGRAGRAEERFMEGMIDHHQMALDMANDCLTRASDETVRALCQAVIDAQTPEIEMLQGWLLAWYGVTYAPMPMAQMSSGGHDHSMSEAPADPPGMMGMMAGLSQLEGVDYDVAWIEAMVDHHDDAIHMAERLLARNPDGHAELLELAQNIIDAQSAEIETIEALIVDLTD